MKLTIAFINLFLLTTSVVYSTDENHDTYYLSLEKYHLLRTPREVNDHFPPTFIKEIKGEYYELNREINIDCFSHQPKSFYVKKELDLTNLNQEMISFKNKNGLHISKEGMVAIFDGNHFSINGEKASIQSVNIFEEGFRYIVDEDFNLLLTDKGNHSSIFAGLYVLGAGILKFNENGKISFISNATGHYRSSDYQLQMIVKNFTDKEMIAEDAIIRGYTTGRAELYDFLKKQVIIPESIITLNQSRLSNISPFSSPIKSEESVKDNLISSSPKSLSRKVLDSISYEEEMMRAQHRGAFNNSFGTPTVEEQVMQEPPHGELYNQVIAIQKHSKRWTLEFRQ